MCGLTDLTNSPDESLQIASAISIMKLEEDDEYDMCEPEPDRDRDDNSIEVVQIPTAPPLAVATIERTTNKKKTQRSITNYFKAKKEWNAFKDVLL